MALRQDEAPLWADASAMAASQLQEAVAVVRTTLGTKDRRSDDPALISAVLLAMATNFQSLVLARRPIGEPPDTAW